MLDIACVAKRRLLPISLPPLIPKLLKLIPTTKVVHYIMIYVRALRRISKPIALKGTSWPIASSRGGGTP